MAAMKAAKRSSTAGAPRSKRARAGEDVAAQCKQIADVLGTATVFPASVLEMLSACLVPAMSAYKEERHAQQTQAVAWIGEAMADIEAQLDKNAAEASSHLEAAQADLGLREAAVAEQETSLKGLEEALDAAAEAAALAAKALAEAESKLKSADEERATGESEIEAASSRKAEVEDLIKASFEELKAAPGKKKAVDSFLSKAKKEKVEEGLLKAAPVALGKSPELRTEFDNLVLTKVGEALQRRVAEFDETITQGDASKARLSAAVEAANEAVAAAKEKKEAAAAKSSEAQAAAKEGEKAVKEAKKAHKGAQPAVKEAEAALKAASAGAQRFKSGPLAAYAALRDRAAPAPEPEPEASGEPQESA